MNPPGNVTFQMIWIELQKIKKDLKIIKSEKIESLVDEVSLNKARILTRRGSKFLMNEVNTHRLRAMIEIDDKGKKKYKFKYADIVAWQANRKRETALHYAGVQHLDDNWAKKFTENFHRDKEARKKGVA